MKMPNPAHFITDWRRILWRKFHDVQYCFYQRVSIVGLFRSFRIFALCARHLFCSLITEVKRMHFLPFMTVVVFSNVAWLVDHNMIDPSLSTQSDSIRVKASGAEKIPAGLYLPDAQALSTTHSGIIDDWHVSAVMYPLVFEQHISTCTKWLTLVHEKKKGLHLHGL